MPPKLHRKTTNDFRFIQSIRLPVEWQEQLQQAFQNWSIEEVKAGRKPFLTNFVKMVFAEFLNSLKK